MENSQILVSTISQSRPKFSANTASLRIPKFPTRPAPWPLDPAPLRSICSLQACRDFLGESFSLLCLAIHRLVCNFTDSSPLCSRPLSVTIHPAALLSILDHYLRGTTEGGNQRVIGTLLGLRNDNNEVEVRNSFAALHSETEEQIVVDMDYHRSVYDLYQKVNPKEVIVGW